MKTENLIIYNKEFDAKFRYDGKDLGAICTKEGTIFKVWCPLADRVELNIYKEADIQPKKQKISFGWSLSGCFYCYFLLFALLSLLS